MKEQIKCQEIRNIKHYQTTTLALPLKLEHINCVVPSLEHIKWIRGTLKDLVKMSISWLLELINLVLISLDCSFFRTKWQSISICFVLSWNTGLEVMWRAAWLSQYNFIWWTSQNFNYWSCLIHNNSQVTRAIALYSAFAIDQAKTLCFLLFQETIFPPKDTPYPVVDRLSMGWLAQSASQYPQIWVFPLSLYNNPCPGVFLMYLRMWITTF